MTDEIAESFSNLRNILSEAMPDTGGFAQYNAELERLKATIREMTPVMQE